MKFRMLLHKDFDHIAMCLGIKCQSRFSQVKRGIKIMEKRILLLLIALALLSQRKRGTKISGLFLFSCQSLQRLDLFLKADVKSRDYRIVIHLSNIYLLMLFQFSPWSWARSKVSLLGVDSLWGDCTFIPADWGS